MFVVYCRVRFETKPYNNHNETIIHRGATHCALILYLETCTDAKFCVSNFASQSMQCIVIDAMHCNRRKSLRKGATHCNRRKSLRRYKFSNL